MLNQLLPDRLEIFLEKHINKNYSFFTSTKFYKCSVFLSNGYKANTNKSQTVYNDFIEMQYRVYNIKSECELTGVGERIT